MSQDFLQVLRNLLGATHVLQGEGLERYTADWRKRMVGRPLAVALPGNTRQVLEVMRACAQYGHAVVPQGGNTGLVLGGIPDLSGTQVLLSTQRMNQVMRVDSANRSMTVQAGCVLQTVQQAAREQGLLFPLSLAAEGSCTVGGNLATNAGGTQVLRYGTMRDLCLGLEVVTAQGEVWSSLSGLRKDNTGYDLRHLMIGSEGTLGIITQATLRLFARPTAQVTALVASPHARQVLALLGLAQQHAGDALSAFEVMGAPALKLVHQHFPQLSVPMLEKGYAWLTLLELSSMQTGLATMQMLETLLQQAMERQVISDAVIAHNAQQAHQLWHAREAIPLAQNEDGLNIKHDIALPISAIPDFVHATDALLESMVPGIRFVNFGHWGDGNLHYNVRCPLGSHAQAFLQKYEQAINTVIYDQVQKFQGSISAEHGIGALKRQALQAYKSPVALQAMRAIKRALDPGNLLNPGKLLTV